MSVITDEGRRIRRVLIRVAVIVASLNLLVIIVNRLNPSEVIVGPAGSSRVTTAAGVAAWRELLITQGITTGELTEPYLPGNLDPASTLVIVEPGLFTVPAGEAGVLRDFVAEGGRLIIAGRVLEAFLQDVLDDAPTWLASPNGGVSTAAIAGQPMLGVERLNGGGTGVYTDIPNYRVLARTDSGPTVITGVEGRVTLVADAGIFFNRRIDEADNPLFAVNLGRLQRVIFDEHVHGFGSAGVGTALQILPQRWATFFQLGLVAVFVWLIAYGRRFSPQQLESRPLPPSRSEFVDSVAANLARTRQPSNGVRRLAGAARSEIERNAPPGSDLRRAALAAGLDEAETAVVISGGGNDEAALLKAGKALAKLRSN